MDRDECIARLRAALKRNSGKSWSVTGGRGTAWGWIRIDAPPKRRTWVHYLPEGMPDHTENYRERDGGIPGRGHMSPADRELLGRVLGLEGPVHIQGHSIPAASDYRREAVERAEHGRSSVVPVPYWD